MTFNIIRNTILTLFAMAIVCPPVARAQWLQFGGPNRNFTVDTEGLADKWPDNGPRKLWNRELGDGYTAICVDGDRLYTMYRAGDHEYAVSLDAKTGDTVWEYKYPVEVEQGMIQFGPGPHSTPLIVGERIFTVGITMRMFCFDKRSGSVLWKRDLAKEFGASVPGRGYSASPIAYKNTVILPVGGDDTKGQSIVAFSQSDGKVAWKNHDFQITHASPILIKLAGKTHLVVFMGAQVAGLNPDNGDLIWSHPHKTMYGANLSTPLWNGDDLIFCSAAYDSGARVIRLKNESGKTVTEELWFSKKLRIHHGNAIRVGDHILGSSGDFGPAFLTALDFKTGDVAWRQRGFSKATCLYADGKVIILDEDGNLTLATATNDKLDILSQCQIAERIAWTTPTLVGKTLYIRDRTRIWALDIG